MIAASCVAAQCVQPCLQFFLKQEVGLAVCTSRHAYDPSVAGGAQQSSRSAAPMKLASESADALRGFYLMQIQCGKAGDPAHKRWRLDKQAVKEAVCNCAFQCLCRRISTVATSWTMLTNFCTMQCLLSLSYRGPDHVGFTSHRP